MKDDNFLCTECGLSDGEVFLCGEGYFCSECYDETIKSNNE